MLVLIVQLGCHTTLLMRVYFRTSVGPVIIEWYYRFILVATARGLLRDSRVFRSADSRGNVGRPTRCCGGGTGVSQARSEESRSIGFPPRCVEAALLPQGP